MNENIIPTIVALIASIATIVFYITTTLSRKNEYYSSNKTKFLLLMVLMLTIFITGFYSILKLRDSTVNQLRNEYTHLEEKYSFMSSAVSEIDGLIALRKYKELNNDLIEIRETIGNLNKIRSINKDDDDYILLKEKLNLLDNKLKKSGINTIIEENNKMNLLNREFENEILTLERLLDDNGINSIKIDSSIYKLNELKNELIKMQ